MSSKRKLAPITVARQKIKELEERRLFVVRELEDANKKIAEYEARITDLTAKLQDAETRAVSLRTGKAVFDALGNLEQSAEQQNRFLKEYLHATTQQLSAYRQGLVDAGKMAREAKGRIGAAYKIDQPNQYTAYTWGSAASK